MCIFSQVQVEFVPFRFETEQLTQDPCMWLKKDAKQKCKMPFCQFWKWMNAKVSAKASASAEFHWAPKAISQQADKLMSLKTRGGAIFQVMIHNLKKTITFMLKIWHEMKLSSSLSTSKHRLHHKLGSMHLCVRIWWWKPLLQFLCCWFFLVVVAMSAKVIWSLVHTYISIVKNIFFPSDLACHPQPNRFLGHYNQNFWITFFFQAEDFQKAYFAYAQKTFFCLSLLFAISSP